MTPHETFLTASHPTIADIAAGDEACPVCSRAVRDDSVSLDSLPDDLQKLIRANAPDTREFQAVCGRCVRLFERAKEHIIKDAAMQKDGSHVLSTPLRLDADERFTGKGRDDRVSRFGLLPACRSDDAREPHRRISQSLLDADGDLSSLFQPDVASWHGMMTSVVAAGNGSLSNGFYRGMRPDAEVVLVKLARTGRITDQNIQDGLEWVLENREQYGIRIVNISAGGDDEAELSARSACRRWSRNARPPGSRSFVRSATPGHLPNHPVVPPASARRASRSAASTTIIRSTVRNAACTARPTARPSTACKSPRSSRRRSGYRRRFCQTRRPPSRPSCSKNSTKATTIDYMK